MGEFLNPNNVPYKRAKNSEIYVDKTGLLKTLNKRVNTMNNRICSTRPRRFGKSMAIDMIAAYYNLGEDSKELFSGSQIEEDVTFEKYLNQYDVLKLDMVVMCGRVQETQQLIAYMHQAIVKELKEVYGEYIQDTSIMIESALLDIHLATGKQFIILIDEWDAIFRIYKNDDGIQREYIEFLRSIFKGSSADRFVALAYITGILPIKKYGTQSAMNNFDEFTMINPRILKEYIGFTEEEVRSLCKQYNMDLDIVKQWYDGYKFRGMHIYSPKSIVDAVIYGEYASYWSQTETFEILRDYITMNFDGLKDNVIKMLAGEHVDVHTGTFTNDVVSFASRDDVLTALIHLGYLAYDEEECQVYIPNKEVRSEFENAVRSASWNGVVRAIEQSKKLLRDTWNGNENAVADALERIHSENVSILSYNDENSLSLVIALAYFSAKDEYITIRELPSGKGFADVVFLPRKHSDKPAIVVELKCNSNAEGAIAQIHNRQYVNVLAEYTGDILLVGINYNKDASNENYKHHTCIIERWTKE